jgi:hypothetical protein
VGGARLLVALVAAGYFALLAALGGYGGWDRLGVQARGTTPFLDLRSVTSAWECARRHLGVMQMNPCDPLHRPANYPRIWESLSVLGLGQGSTTILGFVIAVLFLLGVFALVPRRATVAEGIVFALVLCSPAVMLGIARGNVDLVLFTMVVAAVHLLRRGGLLTAAAHVLVLIAAVLKLFPILAGAALLRQRRWRALVGGGAALVAFAAYAFATRDDIRTIARVTPQVNGYSYGVDLLGSWLASGSGGPSARLWNVLLVAAGLAVAVVASRSLATPQRVRARALDRADAMRADAYAAGAVVYLGTYAFLRSYDYRLIFLLLTVPQLVRWSQQGRRVALATLVALLATVWLSTPWTGDQGINDVIVRSQHWLAGQTGLAQPLPPDAIPQLLLFAGLLAGVLAGLRRLPLVRGARARLAQRARVRPLSA